MLVDVILWLYVLRWPLFIGAVFFAFLWYIEED